MLFTLLFWKAAAERAIKTAAQASILVIVGPNVAEAGAQVNAWTIDWGTVAGYAAGGAALSVLFSIASSRFGNDGPSLADETLLDSDTDTGDH